MNRAGPPRGSLVRSLALILMVCSLGWMSGGSALAAPSPTPTSPAAPAPASPGSSTPKANFGIGAANAKGVDGRPYLNYLAGPGSTFDDHVAVINLGAQPLKVNLYVADAAIGTQGQFGYKPRAAKSVDAATWISTDVPDHATTLLLAPRSTTVIPITVHVPTVVEPGDHAAGVIASVISKVTSKNGERVDFEQRVALRTFFRIAGALHPGLTVQELAVHYHGTLDPIASGYVTLSYRVANTGNVRLGAHQAVSVSGLLGSRKPKAALPDVPLLLPHTFVDYSVTIKGVWPELLMHARVRLEPLTVVGDVDPGLPKQITGSTSFWAIPWIILAVLLVLVLAGIASYLRARRRGRPLDGSHRFGDPGPRPSDPGAAASQQHNSPEVART